MININNVVLVGRLTKDIELRKSQSGQSVCSFTVAVNRWSEEADFINCVAWKQSADFLSQYASKGDVVSVEGRIQTRSYEGEHGKVYVTEVVANSVQLLSGKKDEQKNEQTDPMQRKKITSEPKWDLSKEYTPRLDGKPDEEYWKLTASDITADDLPFDE